MALNLPFVVEPKLDPVIEIIGTDASGRIEIERKGYLSVAEKAFVQAANGGGGGAMVKIYALAAKIGTESGKTPQEVFSDITKAGGAEYLGPYQEQISEMMVEATEMQERNRVFTSAALLINRVDPNIDVEDVMEVHPDLLDALDELYQEEEARDTSRLTVISDELQEDESAGKSRKAK